MPRKPGDHDQEPPGGRAAERRREFERARGLTPDDVDAAAEAAAEAALEDDEDEALEPGSTSSTAASDASEEE